MRSLQVGDRFAMQNGEEEDMVAFRGIAGNADRVLVVGTHGQVYEFASDGGVRHQDLDDGALRVVSLSPSGRACIGTKYGYLTCETSPWVFEPYREIDQGFEIASVLQTANACLISGRDTFGASPFTRIYDCDGGLVAEEPMTPTYDPWFQSLWSDGTDVWLAAHTHVRRVLSDGGFEVIDAGVRTPSEENSALETACWVPDAGHFAGGFSALMRSQTGFNWVRDQTGFSSNAEVGDVASIYGTNIDNIWAVGEYGLIYRRQPAGRWDRVQPASLELSIFDAFVSNQAQVSHGHGVVAHRNAGRWQKKQNVYFEASGLWCLADGGFCAAVSRGSTESDGGINPMELSTFVPPNWSAGQRIGDMQFSEIWFDHPQQSFVVGLDASVWVGSLQPFDAGSFTPISTGLCPGEDLKAIHGAGGHVYAVGTGGCVLHASPDAGFLKEPFPRTDQNLIDVWSVDGPNTFAASQQNVFVRRNGTWMPTVADSATQGNVTFESVWSDGSSIWAVGSNIILHTSFDLSRPWAREFPGIGYSAEESQDFVLTKVRGNQEGIFVFGTSGTILFKPR